MTCKSLMTCITRVRFWGESRTGYWTTQHTHKRIPILSPRTLPSPALSLHLAPHVHACMNAHVCCPHQAPRPTCSASAIVLSRAAMVSLLRGLKRNLAQRDASGSMMRVT
jgi:hypothetical protein